MEGGGTESSKAFNSLSSSLSLFYFSQIRHAEDQKQYKFEN